MAFARAAPDAYSYSRFCEFFLQIRSRRDHRDRDELSRVSSSLSGQPAYHGYEIPTSTREKENHTL